MAHRQAWTKIVDEQIQTALIVQDDVTMHDDFAKVAPMFLRKTAAKTDILFLHNMPLDGEHYTADAQQFIVEDPPMQRFVGAYFLTLKGATSLLNNFQPAIHLFK